MSWDIQAHEFEYNLKTPNKWLERIMKHVLMAAAAVAAIALAQPASALEPMSSFIVADGVPS
jgi:hypothetical protein